LISAKQDFSDGCIYVAEMDLSSSSQGGGLVGGKRLEDMYVC
jgi:hypothetical protein